MLLRAGQVVMVLAFVAGCTQQGAERSCNVQVVAPALRIDVAAYRSVHSGAVARVCRRALRAEPLPRCPTYDLDSAPRNGLSMFAPPYGMVISVTLTSGLSNSETSLRVEGRGGRCGAYTYPPLRLTTDGRLVAA